MPPSVCQEICSSSLDTIVPPFIARSQKRNCPSRNNPLTAGVYSPCVRQGMISQHLQEEVAVAGGRAEGPSPALNSGPNPKLTSIAVDRSAQLCSVGMGRVLACSRPSGPTSSDGSYDTIQGHPRQEKASGVTSYACLLKMEGPALRCSFTEKRVKKQQHRPKYTHRHTQTYSNTHIDTHTDTHVDTQATHVHLQIHTHTHYFSTDAYTHTQTQMYMRTHVHTCTHVRMHTYKRTHAHTNTHVETNNYS